jgi:hypothetical protein
VLQLIRKRVVGVVAISFIVIAAGVLFVASRPRPYDRSFDARVRDPAYRGGGPIVLYDEGHLNSHTVKGAYRPLADLIRNDGYELSVTRQSLSARMLAGVFVLVVVLARGSNDANDNSAFTDSETIIVDQWVRDGGSLLLVTDHWPYGPAVASLVERFGVKMGRGLVEDPEHHEPSRGDSHLVFSTDNRLLMDHPIVRGRDEAERIRRVLTFTGQSILGPPAAIPFLALSDAAVERPPTTPQVTKTGGDVRVSMNYGDPVSAKGRSQGIALELEKGRIVILGEAGMLRAERARGRMPVGMNVPGYDNRQLAINIMHWLSRVL